MDTELYISNDEFTEDEIVVSNFVTLLHENFYIMILIK